LYEGAFDSAGIVNPSYIFTPPPGSVYINTGLSDKGIYIGGDSYVPYKPIDIPKIEPIKPIVVPNRSWDKP